MSQSGFSGNYRYGPTECLYRYDGTWRRVGDEIHWEVMISRPGAVYRPGNGNFKLPDAASPLDGVAKAVAAFIDRVHLDS